MKKKNVNKVINHQGIHFSIWFGFEEHSHRQYTKHNTEKVILGS